MSGSSLQVSIIGRLRLRSILGPHAAAVMKRYSRSVVLEACGGVHATPSNHAQTQNKGIKLEVAVICNSVLIAFLRSCDADGGQFSPSPAGFGRCRRLALVAGAAGRRGGG